MHLIQHEFSETTFFLSPRLWLRQCSSCRTSQKGISDTVVPNYTNGVAAQPNSYAHYLFGYLASFERDQHKLKECYERINYSPMGTTVLNGTSWPAESSAHVGLPGI